MRVLIPMAEGVEEMEIVIMLDLLRRAGIEAVAAAPGETLLVTASRGVKLMADRLWADIVPSDFDMIALPGGMGGTRRLRHDPSVLAALRECLDAGRPVAAICAGPLVLQEAGVIEGKTITCHPGVREEITQAKVSQQRVVEDGLIITSQGPGSAFEFSLALVRRLLGDRAAARVAEGLVLPHGTEKTASRVP